MGSSSSSMLPHLPSSLTTHIHQRQHSHHCGGHHSLSSSSDVTQSGHKSQSSIGQQQQLPLSLYDNHSPIFKPIHIDHHLKIDMNFTS